MGLILIINAQAPDTFYNQAAFKNMVAKISETEQNLQPMLSFAEQPRKTCLDGEITHMWLCVYPDRKVYFETTNNKEVFCIRIDSTFNDGTILYPFSDLHELSWDCFSINSGSWLSKYIVIDEEGNSTFINGNNEPVFIKSQADLNENWSVFENYNLKVVGEVVSKELQFVLGVEDSVKTISFSVYDHNDVPINHELNQKIIEVSQHFGLVKTVNFYYFEHAALDLFNSFRDFNLIGIDEPQLGFQNINLREQYYDYQEDDEFHIYYEVSGFGESDIRKTINRYLTRTDYQDSIIYFYEMKQQRITRNYIDGELVETTTNTTNTIKQKINKGLLFATEPNEPYIGGDWEVQKVKIWNNQIPTMHYFQTGLTENGPDCFSENIWYDNCGFSTYSPGLGGPFSGCCEIFQTRHCDYLVYYKKGDTEVGTPFDWHLSFSDFIVGESLFVYPNPTKEYITIISSNNEIFENAVIEIYDLNGIKQQTKYDLDAESIDVSFLKQGFYTLKLIQKNNDVFYLKFVKI
ncbi:MAG: T9SS type A sorting domain-containing protein [Marinilabiliaceae bacterium]|nr:T9SS type A sorting domain-containing protein [Marinilabiliaceae bacterium]